MFFEEMDKFDLALGLYHWLQHTWESQGDEKYSDFCSLIRVYKPSPSNQYFENIDDMARLAYDSLTDFSYRVALELVIKYQPLETEK